MSLTNPNTPVSQQDLQDFYHKLVPYMGGSFGAIANKFSKGDMYSTDEKMIGQWTDGKPIYQKTFTGLNVSCAYNSWVTIVSAPANIDTLLFAFPLDIGNKVFPSIECRINSGKIQGENTMASTTRIVNALTIQYTKSTDSAISIGDDTDYSTEEKIVGTWIDGKPLYQKTIEVSNITFTDITSTRYVDLLEASNLNLIDAKGIGEYTVNDRTFTRVLNNATYNDAHNTLTLATDFYKDSSNNYIRLRIAQTVTASLVLNIHVTIQYTKITD